MSDFRKVRCSNCKKRFYKYRWHVEENLKLGHNFFCSLKCQSEHRRTGKWFICGNDLCKKKFYRERHAILKYNYCSQSCAAIVNNQKYPKWPKRYCAGCGQEFKNRDSNYCSIRCGRLAIHNYRSTQSKYTREQIISAIKDFYQQHQRTPAKREILEVVGCATHKFGSWTATIQVAGLTPNRSHDNRMYKRIKAKAEDGHICDSISEALIDNWLTRNKIPHERDVPYPNTNHKADWAVKNNKIFIEYFGLAKDSPRYDRSIRKKKKLCEKFEIKLIEIYPKDIYPNFNIENKFNFLQKGRKD